MKRAVIVNGVVFSRPPCEAAQKWLEYHPDPSEAWRSCKNGAWLAWAIEHIELPPETKTALDRVVEKFAGRAIEKYALHCGIDEVERWAARWLSGEDRSRESARAVVRTAEAWAEARTAWSVKAWEGAWMAEAWNVRTVKNSVDALK